MEILVELDFKLIIMEVAEVVLVRQVIQQHHHKEQKVVMVGNIRNLQEL